MKVMTDFEGRPMGVRAVAWHVVGIPFGLASLLFEQTHLHIHDRLLDARDWCWHQSVVHREQAALAEALDSYDPMEIDTGCFTFDELLTFDEPMEGRCIECEGYVDDMATCVNDPRHDTGHRICPTCHGDAEDPGGETCYRCDGSGVVLKSASSRR